MPFVFPIGLDPVAFSPGGVDIRWYGLFVALAIAVALARLVTLARRKAALMPPAARL